MEIKLSAKNQRFLEDNDSVLVHHVDCILMSRMLLNEDMQLLTTFWNPNLSINKPSLYLKLAKTAALCAATGLIVPRLHNSLNPLAAMLIPVTIQVYSNTKTYYDQKTYKREFERLVYSINELYNLNNTIVEYYEKRMVAYSKAPSQMLLTLIADANTGFLKTAVSILTKILVRLRDVMVEISKLVPITEGEYIYFLKWDLIELTNDENAEPMAQFEKLADVYLLVVSNFMCCIGLSMCFQLWKDGKCDFKRVLTVLLPETCRFLERSVRDLEKRFDSVRFILRDTQRDTNMNLKKKISKQNVTVYEYLKQPLRDFLGYLQVAFETSARLQSILEDEDESVATFQNMNPYLDSLSHQLLLCDKTFSALVRSFVMSSKQHVVQNIVAKKQARNPNYDGDEQAKAEVRALMEFAWDDPFEELQDEEYNLSIHGDDDDVNNEDPIGPICEYADQCTTEHLETMLSELKKKLLERKAKRGEQVDSEEILPPPPPLPIPPTIPPLPEIQMDSTHHQNVLAAVKMVASQMNREEEFQFGFNMFPDLPRPFNTTYRCFSVAMLPGNERQDVERGGKIIMPPSALEQLTRLNINYPMLFKIVNKQTNRTSHCGVLEFVADEGKVYLPLWMMHNLVLEEGDLIQIESVSLAVGTFAKFQPLSPDFLDITNPKAVLENCLRTFACLTSGDVIAVKYNQRVYELCVLETKPGNAISIIECDMNVEFAPPVGYKEAEKQKTTEEEMVVDPADLMPEPSGFVAFRGTGNRLDGKRRKDSGPSDSSPAKPVYVRGIPDYDYELGTLRFLRHFAKSSNSNDNKEENEEFKAFSGEGFSLKRRN